MHNFNRLENLLSLELAGKKILLRADLNVPVKAGKVSDSTRITALAPTILKLVDAGAKVIIISHFGRPEGYDSTYSLSSIVDEIELEIKKFSGKNIKVNFGVDCAGSAAKQAVNKLQNGEVLILENLRFHAEEEANDKNFSQELASLADYYVNDAFSCSHRAHSSITGVAEILPSFAGLQLETEIDSLTKALFSPERPLGAIVGGSKVSSKIDLLYSLTEKADYIFIGGGMANTFLYAKGLNVGVSLCEKDLKKKALEILKRAEEKGSKIFLPIDAAVANSLAEGRNSEVVAIENIPAGKMILDIGTQTVVQWNEVISKCRTIIWNGPVGAFEHPPFDNGSVALARSVAYFTSTNNLNSVAGGGDTVALLVGSGLRDSFSYISTAGGAFLEWLEGKNLPGIQALIDSAAKKQAA